MLGVSFLYAKIKDLYRWSTRLFIIEPLWNLYIDAPSIAGVGGWGGKDPADICAELTTVTSRHWAFAGGDECSRFIDKKFESHLSVGVSVLRLVCFCMLMYECYSICRIKIYKYVGITIQDREYIPQLK